MLEAFRSAGIACVRDLIATKAPVDGEGEEGRTALAVAAAEDHADLAGLLLTANADPRRPLAADVGVNIFQLSF